MTTTAQAGASTAPAAGPDRIPKPSQGWYRVPGTDIKLRRVTTILGQGFPKPQLVFWAANLTAEDAFANLPRLVAVVQGIAREGELDAAVEAIEGVASMDTARIEIDGATAKRLLGELYKVARRLNRFNPTRLIPGQREGGAAA